MYQSLFSLSNKIIKTLNHPHFLKNKKNNSSCHSRAGGNPGSSLCPQAFWILSFHGDDKKVRVVQIKILEKP